METNKTIKELLEEAKEAEKGLDAKKAENLYLQAILIQPLNELPYNRLMAIYRKQKQFKKERGIVKKAITSYEKFYRSLQPKRSKAVAELSKKLNRSTGLSDKTGNLLYSPGPLAKWKKRLIVVETKLEKLG